MKNLKTGTIRIEDIPEYVHKLNNKSITSIKKNILKCIKSHLVNPFSIHNDPTYSYVVGLEIKTVDQYLV